MIWFSGLDKMFLSLEEIWKKEMGKENKEHKSEHKVWWGHYQF